VSPTDTRPVPPLESVPEPTDREFESLRALVLRHAGIYLNDSKKPLLYGRLARRIRELGLGTFGAYHQLVRQDDAELVQMLDRITTNETRFFREPHHFEFLAREHLPRMIRAERRGERAREVSVWSAGCATGEEPYSIAMTLVDHLPTGWSIRVLATDLSTRALEVARSATWPAERAADLGDARLRRHILRGVGSQEGLVRAADELRSLVRVERLNLSADPYPPQAFDLIFCRNVLIYFHPEQRERVLRRMADHLSPGAPGGLLFVGHAESVPCLSGRVRAVGATVYARVPDAPEPQEDG
jgi:chemotaxis protein methyltransferase CheR